MLKSTVKAMLAVRKAADVCDMPGEAHILRMLARELDTFDMPDPALAMDEFLAMVATLHVVYHRSNSNALDAAIGCAVGEVRALVDDARQSANPPLMRVVVTIEVPVECYYDDGIDGCISMLKGIEDGGISGSWDITAEEVSNDCNTERT